MKKDEEVRKKKDLFTDSEGTEAMFQTRAITVKIERHENTDL